MQYHLVEKKYICPLEGCGKAFMEPYCLKTHQDRHNLEKQFQCDLCDRAFVIYKDMLKHRKIHSSNGTFSCGYPGCEKTFKLKKYLKAHELVHIENKVQKVRHIVKMDPADMKHKCKVCLKGFRYKSMLKYHEVRHQNKLFSVLDGVDAMI